MNTTFKNTNSKMIRTISVLSLIIFAGGILCVAALNHKDKKENSTLSLPYQETTDSVSLIERANRHLNDAVNQLNAHNIGAAGSEIKKAQELIKAVRESISRTATETNTVRSVDDLDPFAFNLDSWDPFKEMRSMQDRIDQMFGSAFNRFQKSDDFSALSRSYRFAPDVNIEDQGEQYQVTVDLPGTDTSQIDVKLEDQMLTVSGHVKSESKETNQKGKMLREERRAGSFRRSMTLPGPVQMDKMTTTNKNGVVIITIPKAK
ncbi:MAG: Hsp20/alpha crystallin family protein [bacterium]